MYIPIKTRLIIFKYLHGILPNKYRFKQIRILSPDLCDYYKLPETIKQMVYQCLEISDCWSIWCHEYKYDTIDLIRHTLHW